MDRRAFIAIVGGSIPFGRLTARAQSLTSPVIGYLANASLAGFATFVAAFRSGLGEMRYAEGQNVAIEYRWAEGQHDRGPSFPVRGCLYASSRQCIRRCGRRLRLMRSCVIVASGS